MNEMKWNKIHETNSQNHILTSVHLKIRTVDKKKNTKKKQHKMRQKLSEIEK